MSRNRLPRQSDLTEPPKARIITDFYPLELHHIKALFFERRYREVIVVCRDLLYFAHAPGANTLRNAFVRFYLALAHDELARTMHKYSYARIPAFNQAAQYYDEALSALPTTAECLALIPPQRLPDIDERPSPEAVVPSRHDSLQSHSGKRGHSRFFSVAGTAPLSPPTYNRHNSFPVRSPPMSVAGTTNSDFDDLESHDSYNEIRTPTRLPKLERDYSSMSLLQPAQHQRTHSLMRPVRMASPAKSYYPPGGPRRHPSAPQPRSVLPRLDTTSQRRSPVGGPLHTTSEEASPIDSPVSPLGSEADSIFSETSTISPISPETPMGWRQSVETDVANNAKSFYPLLEDHLQAMRVQLHSHLRMLQHAKQKTFDAQKERNVAQEPTTKGKPPTTSSNKANPGHARTPSDRDFWSFTPRDVKVIERQNRIEAGRARQWRRVRFDPTRYRELAAAAVSEL